MIRRILIGLFAVVGLGIGSFAGYGWWTRRGAPEFTKGGEFSLSTPDPTPSPSAAVKVKPRQATRARQEGVASEVRTTEAPEQLDRSGIALPPEGTYAYAGRGRESVTFGPTSACSWDIEDVTSIVKHTNDGVVFDWTFSDQRLERLLLSYDRKAVKLTFAGAAVTCVGVRRTSEEEYTPPSVWVQLPLTVGDRWKEDTRAGERRERSVSEVLRTERVSVPAGTFTAYVVRSDVTLSGSEEGTLTTTHWFVPELGTSVRKTQRTEVDSSGAHFSSRMTLELSDLPD